MSRVGLAILAGALALVVIGCGADTTTADRRQALEDYVAKVQPIRLGINDLLDKADPILEGYRDGDLSAAKAERRMGRIEHGAADYAVRIAALEGVPDEMRAAQDAYAHTFVLQDTYLSALVAGLPDRAFDELPRFQNQQRAAIIARRSRTTSTRSSRSASVLMTCSTAPIRSSGDTPTGI